MTAKRTKTEKAPKAKKALKDDAETPAPEVTATDTAEAPAETETTDAPAKDGKPTKKGGKKAKATKAAKEKKPKKLSALDAAAQVLGLSEQPMNCPELIEAMARRGLWESPNGQTPHATLYAAILREINTKGKEARFKKTGRGTFAATKAGA